ncbi:MULTISPECIES: polyhydroxyalkanoate synthesis repressor PhaR [unclassified Roseitalea]|uniref:polyhydroxyalkanoate synthesis repressor PhaR n=1 Tax=unclassified Roseitalea TaxID=2639107 RepID=UPI00273F204E|nr:MULTISPECIES: polyhydroxyalkanoate synthesis repressor PhaR [unclassified Roseitalea]
MAKNDGATIIKKYANRRLYNTGTSTYVTLDDLATMVKEDIDFTVQDAKSGEDITHSVLTQIIFEQEAKSGQTMLPVSVLRQLISFYGDQMQMVVPSYLEHSMAAFAKEQERIREQMTDMIGKSPMDVMATSQQMMREQTERNMAMFQEAMKMFNPFTVLSEMQPGSGGSQTANGEDASADDLQAMREQIAEMQRKLDKMG